MVPLFYNKIFSDTSELQYAYSELPFVCPPSGRRHPGAGLTSGSSISLNLGEVLRGDRIVISDYELIVGEDQEVRYLCSHEVSAKDVRFAQRLIRDEYMIEWIVDNLPGATSFVTTDKSRKYYAAGFKMGYETFDPLSMQDRFYINNHHTFVIRYRNAPGKAGEQGKKVVVGFEVYPKSIEAQNRNLTSGEPFDIHSIEKSMELEVSNVTTSDGVEEKLTIPYTYSVYFREETRVDWQNRWDMYFVQQDENPKVHWLATINSLLIAGSLTTFVAVVFTRTIRGDIKACMDPSNAEEGKIMLKSKFAKGLRSPRKSMDKSGSLLEKIDADHPSDVASDDEALDDVTGWKLVHGDVFRTPAYGVLLAPLVGSGTQLVFMATGLLILSCIGVLNPSFRGGFVSVGFALFVIAGLFSGYFSSRVYRTFGGQNWKRNVFVTGTLIPGLVFSSVFGLNLFVWAQAASNAVPVGTLLGLVALWLLVQLPLVYLGGWYGFEVVGAWVHPVRPNPVPRYVPAGSWRWVRNAQVILVAGALPFAVIFVELLFVFKSLWLDKTGFYYVFGFLGVVSAILMVSVAEVTILAVYMQLCAEVSFIKNMQHVTHAHGGTAFASKQ